MNNNKGVAIFITLMLLFLLSLTAIAVLLGGYNYNNICEGQIRRIKAITSAEAGIAYAYYQIRNDSDTHFTVDHKDFGNAATITIGNGLSVQVWVEDQNPPVTGKYVVKARSEYQKTTIP